MKRCLLIALASCMVWMAGCGSPGTPGESTEPTQLPQAAQQEDLFSDRDLRGDHSGGVAIRLLGDTAEAASQAVTVQGSTVTITGDGTYVLSGTLEGSVIIDAGEKAKPQLVLEGAEINSPDGAALEIREADKVFVTLAEGTENTLSNGGAFADEAVDAPLFSRQDLTLNGTGALSVTSPSGHGIVCKDDLVFTGGSYQIRSAFHGLDVNDSVRITGNTALTLDAGQDGIHCENNDDSTLGFVYLDAGTLTVEAEGDGISAGSDLRLLGGSITVTAGGGHENGTKASSGGFGGFMGGRPGGRPPMQQEQTTEDSTSMKALKAAGNILIGGGTFLLDCADDGIHSDTSITVSGGSFDISSGDDALHAEQELTVTDCKMNIQTSYEGLEAKTLLIQGGKLMIRSTDDGLNAAGGTDESGFNGGRDGMFGGRPDMGGRPGMGGGPGMGGASDGQIRITGGELAIWSSGDGMDSNGSITVTDGKIYITNPTSGDTSVLDSDTGATITGGTFLGAGASTMMAQSFTADSTQGVIACTVGNQPAGTPPEPHGRPGQHPGLLRPGIQHRPGDPQHPGADQGRNLHPHPRHHLRRPASIMRRCEIQDILPLTTV